MPGQDMHILVNPTDPDAGPWYPVPTRHTKHPSLRTPEWTFSFTELMRFKAKAEWLSWFFYCFLVSLRAARREAWQSIDYQDSHSLLLDIQGGVATPSVVFGVATIIVCNNRDNMATLQKMRSVATPPVMKLLHPGKQCILPENVMFNIMLCFKNI